jgi:hypothetical protein
MIVGGGLWLFTVLIVTGLWYELARVRKYKGSQKARDLAARKTIEDLENDLAPNRSLSTYGHLNITGWRSIGTAAWR